MKEENIIDSSLYNISRLAIIVPMVILVTGISIRIMGFNTIPQSPTLAQIQLTPTLTPDNTNNIFSNVVQNSSASEPKLDLKGPWTCNLKTKTNTSIQAFIKNYAVSATITDAVQTQHLIVNGDCLYQWTTTQQLSNVGQKTCGISQYLSMFDLFTQFNVINSDALIGILPGSISQLLPIPKDIDLKSFISSCVKDTVADTVFTVPTTITFTSVVNATPTSQPKKN